MLSEAIRHIDKKTEQEYLYEKIHRGSSAADGFSDKKTSAILQERKTETMELQEKNRTEQKTDMQNKEKALLTQLDEIAKQDLCLAFSGGVDSSLLLKLVMDASAKYGTKVYAVTFQTRLHPPCDLETATRVAKEVGAVHEVLFVDELEQEAIRYNPENRCYLCKHYLFGKLLEFARDRGVTQVLDGTNEDDLYVYRPGRKALREYGVISPLAACHVTKTEVKALAAKYGVSIAHRPSTPCMATRLPYGAEINYDVLDRIADGEAWLHTLLGAEENLRLRVHGDVVRLEIAPERMGEERRNDCIFEKARLFLPDDGSGGVPFRQYG